MDDQCENGTVIDPKAAVEVKRWDTCNYLKGLDASRISATLGLAFTDKGQDRYDTMVSSTRAIFFPSCSSFLFTMVVLFKVRGDEFFY